MRQAAWLAVGLSAAWLAIAQPAAAEDLKPVPFVGCRSDGQTGPLAAPRRASGATPRVPGAYARRLAYYEIDGGFGVLAPRGWRCFGLYGSSGSAIYVAPRLQSFDPSGPGPRLVGPGVELDGFSSETSGRFEVADVAARFFPSAKDFVRQVAAEGIQPITPLEVTTADRILAQTPARVDVVTAPGRRGLGTRGYLRPSRLPIRGAFILARDGLSELRIRLSSADADLVAVIINGEAKRVGVADR